MLNFASQNCGTDSRHRFCDTNMKFPERFTLKIFDPIAYWSRIVSQKKPGKSEKVSLSDFIFDFEDIGKDFQIDVSSSLCDWLRAPPLKHQFKSHKRNEHFCIFLSRLRCRNDDRPPLIVRVVIIVSGAIRTGILDAFGVTVRKLLVIGSDSVSVGYCRLRRWSLSDA